MNLVLLSDLFISEEKDYLKKCEVVIIYLFLIFHLPSVFKITRIYVRHYQKLLKIKVNHNFVLNRRILNIIFQLTHFVEFSFYLEKHYEKLKPLFDK